MMSLDQGQYYEKSFQFFINKIGRTKQKNVSCYFKRKTSIKRTDD